MDAVPKRRLPSGRLIAPLFMISLLVAAGVFILVVKDEPLAVISHDPVNAAGSVDLYSDIEVVFSYPVDPASFASKVSFSPGIVGEWNVSGSTAMFKVGARMDSNTTYTVTMAKGLSSLKEGELEQDHSFSFTTGNTSSRIAGNQTSVQLDYIAMTSDDNLTFATSLQGVVDDDSTYPKSPYYVQVYKPKLGKLRRFPVVIGKEDEFKAIEEQVLGMRIGETKTFTLAPGEIFGEVNASLVYNIPLNQTVNMTETMDNDTAISAFGGNLSAGSVGVHPLWGWNVSLIDPVALIVNNEPEDGMIVHPYGWDTVVAVDGNNISIQHLVNNTHLDTIFGIAGTFPEEVFMVRQVNTTADHVVVDENWPPGVVGRSTTWIVTVYDIKISAA